MIEAEALLETTGADGTTDLHGNGGFGLLPSGAT